jgi:hypothetical protein
MRYALALCFKWYGPEGVAAARGEVVDYEILCLGIGASEQAADRMGLPHTLHGEEADDALQARMSWFHETQGFVEKAFDCSTESDGFEDESNMVDTLSTYQIDTPQLAWEMMDGWRGEMVTKAKGEDGIGAIVQLDEMLIREQDAEAVLNAIEEAKPFDPNGYQLRPVRD